MLFHRERIASLDCLVLAGSKKVSLSLFHGYGASMEDLAPLSEFIRDVTDATLYFPNAPLQVAIGPGYYGYAWFPIDFGSLEVLNSQNEACDLSLIFPEGFSRSREFLDEFYREILKRHEKNIIGGFSQGAMLATDLSLRSEKSPEGLLILSGTLVNETEWKNLAKRKSPLSFFQSHGFSDPILPFGLAKRLFDLLKSEGHKGEFVEFWGGHEIPEIVLRKMLSYLKELVKNF